MKLKYFDKFIDLILNTGIEMKKGQCLYVSFDAALSEHAEELAVAAYKKGAKYVLLDPKFMHASKARLESSSLEDLNYLPKFTNEIYKEVAELPWSRIHLDGKGDPNLFSGVDSAKSLEIDKKFREVAAPFRKSIIRGDIPWCISALPTAKWAALVMQKPESEATTLEFWDLLVKVLRLDTPNPSETWKNLGQKLEDRANILNKKKFKSLEFQAPGTDLKVDLIQESKWAGGSHLNEPHNFRYLANIPTEEVFTSPDWRKTQGKVRLTRPVEVMNQIIEDAEFEFKDGKVINFTAKKGASTLEAFFNSDEQARYLGEVALVDTTSPIYQSGKIFSSILFDENAACHFAFGGAYPLGVEDRNLGPDELKKLGFNVSIQHTDFMMGCPEMNVWGVYADGRREQLLKDGLFIGDLV